VDYMDICEETLKNTIGGKIDMKKAIKRVCKWLFAGGCAVTLGALIEKWHQEYLESVEVNRQLDDISREITESSEALQEKLDEMYRKNQERLEGFDEWFAETEEWLEEQKKLEEENGEHDAE